MFDPDDLLGFFLHEGSGASILNPVASSSQPVFSFVPGGMNYGVTYYISALVGSSAGNGLPNLGDTCLAVAQGTPIVFYQISTANITPIGATTFCEGSSVILNGSTGPGYTYQWQQNGVNIPGATLPIYTATTSGNYTLGVTDDNNCIATSSPVTVTTNLLPTAAFTPAGATTFCQGGGVVLNASTGPGYIYQWQQNSVNIPGATSVSYIAIASGNYTLVVTDGNNCTATSTAQTVTVNSLPTAIITPAGATTFCAGGSAVLNGSIGAGYNYQWKQNGVNIPGATLPIYTATTSGNYTLVVTDGNNCTATSGPVTVTVNNFPIAAITPVGATTFCSGTSVVLNAPMGVGYTYQWQNNGTNIVGATLSSYIATATGNYTVAVTVNGCTATSTAQTVTEPATNRSY
ncbi:MAG: hypothetical protein IPM82_20535 [Saprospiraceae bacterium]|nr:hypothetical protein [Saprospiraceae bacterium]